MMNEKIRELAEQAGFFPVPDETESDWEYRAENARYEKFAKLILEEAMGIVRDEVSFFSDWACADNAVTKVKEHFGIE
jgi:hypothetical protein